MPSKELAMFHNTAYTVNDFVTIKKSLNYLVNISRIYFCRNEYKY